MGSADKISLLRMLTTGSVDCGKSTLMGRLLYETGSIYGDQYAAAEDLSRRRGDERTDLSLILDGLAAEREQGITIDVAYRYFYSGKRKYIIADSPGHEQYTKNMVTAASNSDLALIVIDVNSGITEQTRLHGFIVSLLSVPHIVVAINKMDSVDYRPGPFYDIIEGFNEFISKLSIHDISYIPVSALNGDNIVSRSGKLPWYNGNTLLYLLENIQVVSDRNMIDFRFPVQYVIRDDSGFRGYSGMVVSGTVNIGDEITLLPSGRSSRVESIVTWDGEPGRCSAGDSVVLTLEDDIDVSRGDMITRKNNLPFVSGNIDTMICWMDDKPLDLRKRYALRHTTRETDVFADKLHYRLNTGSLHREPAETLRLNEIGRIEIKTTQPLFFDQYRVNKGTGCFILTDKMTNRTVAAGIIRDFLKDTGEIHFEKKPGEIPSHGAGPEKLRIEPGEWEERNRHRAAVVWLTGLPGSGKSTIAGRLVRELFSTGARVVHLDGDDVRKGLCSDLGFSESDRSENIRRVGEAAKLFYRNGSIVVCSFISPFKRDREFVRSLIEDSGFIEVFVSCDVSVCRERDPKGHYKKADAGEIKEFTGVSSGYEEPSAPEVIVHSDLSTVEECTEKIREYLIAGGFVLKD